MDTPRLLDGRLKIRHLVLLDALSEQRSVVGAAAYLHVTQPVVTRALRELEDILGVPLFERGPRGITPTLFGEAFTDHARAILAQLTQAGRHLVELEQADKGTVTVGTHLAGSNLLLPHAIARLKAGHPNVTVVVHEAMPDALLTGLEAGRIDVIVGRLAAALSRPTTVQRTLYGEPIQLATRTDHPAALAGERELTGLLDYLWILPGAETALRGELERIFMRQDLPLPANRVECTSILTVRQLLVETDAIAALPMLIARDDPHITVLPIPLEPISHTVGLTLPAERTVSPTTRALLTCLEAVAAELRQELYEDAPA